MTRPQLHEAQRAYWDTLDAYDASFGSDPSHRDRLWKLHQEAARLYRVACEAFDMGVR
jgi:hypothetical protein